MIDAKEINAEIARLEYVESSYPNYTKLADLYIIRDKMESCLKSALLPQARFHEEAPMLDCTGASFLFFTSGKKKLLTYVSPNDNILMVTQKR